MNTIKNNFRAAIIFVALSFSILSCSSKPEAGVINGIIKNYKDGYIVLETLTTTSATPKDSCKPNSNGEFKLKFETKEPTFFRVRMTTNNFVLLLLEKEDKIDLSIDATNLGLTAMVKGSEQSAHLIEATHVLQNNTARLDSINKVFTAHQEDKNVDSIKTVLQHYYDRMMANETTYLKNFVDKNSNSIICMAVIDKLSPDNDIDYFKKLDDGLMKSYPNSEYTKSFHNRVSALTKLSIGSPAPDITLNTPDDKPVSLSSYKGKIVLVDFWASWCRPCRGENPNVVRIYNTYHDKGFDVLSVSLDKNKDAWVKAIEDDHLTWTHISDLGQWQSSVVKQYNISGIPFTCLVDKNGNIAAKGLRGEELEQKIKELLAK